MTTTERIEGVKAHLRLVEDRKRTLDEAHRERVAQLDREHNMALERLDEIIDAVIELLADLVARQTAEREAEAL